MEKILITGTGRCGTTFLIKLLSFLNFNTGFNRENYQYHIYSNCNSGMEKHYTDEFNTVIKNPEIIREIEEIVKNKSITIKAVLIPIRDYRESALSRVKNGWDLPGGLWNATNESEQIRHYEKIMSNYVYYMTKYDINTIFIDFDRMVKDKVYLYSKLKPIFDERKVTFDSYSTVYDEVSINSKPQDTKKL